MASSSVRVPLLSVLAKRSFASAAAAANPSSSPEVEVSTLPNKTIVACAHATTPGLAKVAVAVKAGSRYEGPDDFGASHILRCAAGLTTKSKSQFSIVRNLQQMGATLTTTSDRETIIYTIESTTDHVEDAVEYLKCVTSEQAFKPWELTDLAPRVQYEIARIPLRAKLMDLVHRASYRTGLGNSIFAKAGNIKKINSETMQHFVNSTFKSNRAAVVGVGVSHSFLSEFANELGLDDSSGSSSTASKFYGGELRKYANSPLTYVAIASEASGLNKKDVFTYAVLQCFLGGESMVKWGCGASPLSKLSSSLPVPSAAKAFNVAYSDSGLFGVTVASLPENIAKTVEETVKLMKKASSDMTKDSVERAKMVLKNSLLYSGESSGSLVGDLAVQGVLLGSAKAPQDLLSSIDAVQAQHLKDALDKWISSGKKSMAAVGPVHHVPYLDQLF